MSSDAYAVAGIVAVLLPTIYFLIASPTFLLAKFDDPSVTWLMRGLFSLHFRIICIGAVVSIVAFVIAGRPFFVLIPAVIASLAVAMRRWFLRHIDAELSARDAGDARAAQRLRRLHVRGMALNATQCAALIAFIPLVFGTAM